MCVCLCVCVYDYHVAVEQKSTQLYKSTIFEYILNTVILKKNTSPDSPAARIPDVVFECPSDAPVCHQHQMQLNGDRGGYRSCIILLVWMQPQKQRPETNSC